MLKSVLNTIQVEKASKLTFENVLSITIASYSNKESYIKYNDIERKLPPAQLVGGTLVPISYTISCDGTHAFDLKLDFRFFDKNGLALIDFIQIQKC